MGTYAWGLGVLAAVNVTRHNGNNAQAGPREALSSWVVGRGLGMIAGFVDRSGGLVVEAAGAAVSYKGFRFPAEVISHAVWLYHRFPLSFREVEELLLVRGITVSHETVRQWCERFGPQYAAALRRRRPQAGDKWHLDEVFMKVNGVRQYLWRAVDQDGNVLDILLQPGGTRRPRSGSWPSS